MAVRKILLVHKQTIFKKFVKNASGHLIGRLYHHGNPAARELSKENDQHEKSFHRIVDFLNRGKISFDLAPAGRLPPLKKYDLVISVGGDGTMLRVAHKIDRQILWGINSAPAFSVGALCADKVNGFAKKWQRIEKGKSHFKNLSRLQIHVNGKKIPWLALNDVLYANTCPAGTSRYEIGVGGKRENQKSSGVWIATASGSTAAILAAGGKKMPSTSLCFQYCVREPYSAHAKGYRLRGGLIRKDQKIHLVNKTVGAALYIDGTHEIFPLQFGDKIEIRRAAKPLQVIA